MEALRIEEVVGSNGDHVYVAGAPRTSKVSKLKQAYPLTPMAKFFQVLEGLDDVDLMSEESKRVSSSATAEVPDGSHGS